MGLVVQTCTHHLFMTQSCVVPQPLQNGIKGELIAVRLIFTVSSERAGDMRGKNRTQATTFMS